MLKRAALSNKSDTAEALNRTKQDYREADGGPMSECTALRILRSPSEMGLPLRK